MVGTAGYLNFSRSASQRIICETRSLTRQHGALPGRTVLDFCERATYVLFHHVVLSIVRQAGTIGPAGARVNGRNLSVHVPGVSVKRVLQQVSVCVVARPRQAVSVGRLVVSRLPRDRAALCNVAKWIVGEGLRPGRPTVHIDKAAQV